VAAQVGGEITTKTYVNVNEIVRDTLRKIGYTDAIWGIGSENCSVLSAINTQSPDIAMGVNTGGAGDQGMMFGYATSETPELMPLPILLAHNLTRKLAEVRRTNKKMSWIRPDGKSQVTVEYVGDTPKRVTTVVISTQHDPRSHAKIRREIIEHVIEPVLGKWLKGGRPKYHINPTGNFVVGGPQGDAGLTGRKIIVDTYGGFARHGGGAFSGKDPTKVDRSAAYAARWVAKNVVAAKLAKRCEVQVAYAIGVADPVSVMIETFGTGTMKDSVIEAAVKEVFDLKPLAIIDALKLRNPIYSATAAYGHFGRKPKRVTVFGPSHNGKKRRKRTVDLFTWERTDRAAALRKAAERIGSRRSARR